MSVSESVFFHATIAVGFPSLVTPLSTVLIWASFGPFTTDDPSSAGNAPGTPLPFAWWQAAQFAANTFSPRATSSLRSQLLFGSSALADAFLFWSSSHFAKSSADLTSTTTG